MVLDIFTTWTTYGTWLPGDPRGWYERGIGLRDYDAIRSFGAKLLMSDSAILFDDTQRRIVEETISEHCRIRGWELHAVNCRTNHVHALVTADCAIELPREQFKAWCTRKLKSTDSIRTKWWTERGWDIYVDRIEEFEAMKEYIRNQ